ncbi:hypothetical protein Poli38472_012852 [Pythium oligandrum]|uniref:Elicitin n=1 Tax=Pythium oligandrum TaxID=41045 RepID=A0A8K1FHS9_PYTOL|nr:hypothetical protein Poli38472_012852 [Pythium oligandrum]|eukprot:TMW64230.1 hypothetical protein Poli38472_012852 [Pythium oligandrum]
MKALVWLAMALMSGLCAAQTTTDATNTSSSASDTRCDPELLFQKLYVLMPAIDQCAAESDYFIDPDNLTQPTEASLAKFCGSANCTLLSLELDNAGLPSCTIPVGDNGSVPFKAFFNDIRSRCGADGSVVTPGDAAVMVTASHAVVGVVSVLLLTTLV